MRRALFLDRDGIINIDHGYVHRPEQVEFVPGIFGLCRQAAARGLLLVVVTNQSGIARGLLTAAAVGAVNDELQRQVGRFDAVAVCPHAPEEGCGCRKPAPGLVLQAAAALGVRPDETVVIGDIGADVGAAAAAGARSILVPTPVTRREEVEEAPLVATDLHAAVDLVLGGLA